MAIVFCSIAVVVATVVSHPTPKKPLPVGKLGFNLAVLKHFQTDGTTTAYMHKRAPPIDSIHFEDDVVAAGYVVNSRSLLGYPTCTFQQPFVSFLPSFVCTGGV